MATPQDTVWADLRPTGATTTSGVGGTRTVTTVGEAGAGRTGGVAGAECEDQSVHPYTVQLLV